MRVGRLTRDFPGWNHAANRIYKRVENQARDAGINCEFPDFVAGLFGRAIAAGHGQEDVAALVKVFRHADGA